MNFPAELLSQSIILAGPTASGKSALAMLLAERLGGEIVALDSMTVYRGMDIGTAKPTRADCERVPHHMLDVVDPEEEFSVAEYLRQSAMAIEGILGRGRVPLIVGGTGLYLRAMLRGMTAGPEADWELRRLWEQRAREHGPEWLHATLREMDPAAAARLHPNDMRRIIRAIEVFELTGRPISAGQQHGVRAGGMVARLTVWLDPERDWLRERIGQRVDVMMRLGWLDETRKLFERTPGPGRTAGQALGYRELAGHLRGETTLEAAVAQIRTLTCQFAKRQYTWFRSLGECTGIRVTGEESVEELAARVLSIPQTRTGGRGSRQATNPESGVNERGL